MIAAPTIIMLVVAAGTSAAVGSITTRPLIRRLAYALAILELCGACFLLGAVLT